MCNYYKLQDYSHTKLLRKEAGAISVCAPQTSFLFGIHSTLYICRFYCYYFIVDIHSEYLPTRGEKVQDCLDGEVANNSNQDETVNS